MRRLLAALLCCLLPAATKACSQISMADQHKLEDEIAASKVLVVGLHNARCTDAALAALHGLNACVKEHYFANVNDPLWAYLQCKYPEEKVGNMMMHSYVWIGGEFVGNGFKVSKATGGLTTAALTAKLSAAGAETTCVKDCTSISGLTA